jgi:catechol 2,3-dioxygenase-like lactoylglutathione lyase family enzyme
MRAGGIMIIGVHSLIYTANAEAVRAFLRDTLGFRHVDAGHGWLIFALPPAEMGVHPADGPLRHDLYLMCDSLETTMAELDKKGVRFASPPRDEGWGITTSIELPGGGKIGLYEPRHPLAIASASQQG